MAAAAFEQLLIHACYLPIFIGVVIIDQSLCKQRAPNLVVPMSACRAPSSFSVAFSPGGFNMAYTGGPLKVIDEYPDLFAKCVFLGCSTGAVVACCACSGVSAATLAEIMAAFNESFRALGSKGFTKLIGLLGEVLHKHLPDDVHIKCSGRLVIGQTNLRCGWPAWQNALIAMVLVGGAVTLGVLSQSSLAGPNSVALVVLCSVLASLIWLRGCVHVVPSFASSFTSKADLIDAILASASIPLIQDKFPPLRRVAGAVFCDSFATATAPARRGRAVDSTFSMRHVVLDHDGSLTAKAIAARSARAVEFTSKSAPIGTSTILVDWDMKAATGARGLVMADGCRPCGAAWRAAVHPATQLQSRVVNPPTADEMHALMDEGARDFRAYLETIGVLEQATCRGHQGRGDT